MTQRADSEPAPIAARELCLGAESARGGNLGHRCLRPRAVGKHASSCGQTGVEYRLRNAAAGGGEQSGELALAKVVSPSQVRPRPGPIVIDPVRWVKSFVPLSGR